MKRNDTLSLAQVDRRVKVLRKVVTVSHVNSGWIRYIRQALGMTLKQLARKATISTTTVAQAEHGEVSGKLSLATLKKMARAMECDFIYAIVPKTEIDKQIRNAALRKAKEIITKADDQMILETQTVNQPIQNRIRLLADKLIQKRDVW